MQNLRYLFLTAAVLLSAGFVAFLFAAHPMAMLFGKVAMATSVLGFTAAGLIHLVQQAGAALALREEDFHWH